MNLHYVPGKHRCINHTIPSTPPPHRVRVCVRAVPAKKEEGMKFLTISALRGHRQNLKNELFVKEGQKSSEGKGGAGLGGTHG